VFIELQLFALGATSYRGTVCRPIYNKFITLVWQVDNVLIEAGSLIQTEGRSNLF